MFPVCSFIALPNWFPRVLQGKICNLFARKWLRKYNSQNGQWTMSDVVISLLLNGCKKFNQSTWYDKLCLIQSLFIEWICENTWKHDLVAQWCGLIKSGWDGGCAKVFCVCSVKLQLCSVVDIVVCGELMSARHETIERLHTEWMPIVWETLGLVAQWDNN